ncbi:MAG TPA: hypothetical protein VFR33_08315 [Candidatus Dormibacteraeota bacterium]|nr:hypothetical protein [Candidatus Dormibacteraeota bacterium]
MTRSITPEIPSLPNLYHLVSLEEIDHWLARYRELVRSVEGSAHEQIGAVMSRLEAHRRQRRAELS